MDSHDSDITVSTTLLALAAFTLVFLGKTLSWAGILSLAWIVALGHTPLDTATLSLSEILSVAGLFSFSEMLLLVYETGGDI